MIVFFTDFGLTGPYIGQMKSVLAQTAPQEAVIDLFADVPAYDISAAAHLLAAYQAEFPAGTIFLSVVDPGVGSTDREPVIVHADEHWYVGPANGLFNVIAARSSRVEAWRINWLPKRLSASFHGRDLFAPVAAMLAVGSFPDAEPIEYRVSGKQAEDTLSLIYIDNFGNLISGQRAATLEKGWTLELKGRRIPRVRTFSDVPVGEPLCYENSTGLMEIAVNQGRADELFDASVGDLLQLVSR